MAIFYNKAPPPPKKKIYNGNNNNGTNNVLEVKRQPSKWPDFYNSNLIHV